MIKSCKACKKKCCKHGPGPWKKLPPEEYLENFGYPEAYNTQCSKLGKNGLCTIWGKPEFPIECRTYVCQSREFSKDELNKIEAFVEEADPCPRCDSDLVFVKEHYEQPNKEIWRMWDTHTWCCETCGWSNEWTKTDFKKGTYDKKTKKVLQRPKA